MKNELLAPSNLIQVKGEIGIIRQIDEKKGFVEFKNRKCDVSRDGMKGVEITADWLEKLGYKSNKDKNGEYHSIYGEFVSLCEKRGNPNDKSGWFISVEKGIWRAINRVDYIHEIQNLAQAITSERLGVEL